MWYVQTSEGYFKGSSVQGLSLEYGKTPPRYEQIVPITTSVPKLALHMVYYFHAETTNAPPAEGFFYLEGYEPTEIVVPGCVKPRLLAM